MKFASAVDRWFYLVIVAAAVAMMTAVLPKLLSGQISVIAGAGVFLLSVGLPLWLLLSTYYQVSGDLLIIRTGPFSWRIGLDEIHSAKPTRALISSPALSLNRIELCYGQGKRILVSPRDRTEFLQAIGHAN